MPFEPPIGSIMGSYNPPFDAGYFGGSDPIGYFSGGNVGLASAMQGIGQGFSYGGAAGGSYGADSPLATPFPTPNPQGKNPMRVSVCNTPDGSCPGTSTVNSPAQAQSQNTQPGPGGANVTGQDALVTGSVNDLFLRAIIVILGIVFVAMGLRMFTGKDAVSVVTAPVKKAVA